VNTSGPQIADGSERDFVGYGDSPPQFTWPGGARLAVNIVINYEEGAERNVLDGDTEREPLVEAHYDVPPGDRELFAESTFEYGSRVGVWRLLRLCDEFEIVPTVFGCDLAFERAPAVAQAFTARGCDIVGHGHRWIPHARMSRDEEYEHIRLCRDSLAAQFGFPPLGWFTRPPNTVATRRCLAELGFSYDCGAVNDDLPYFVNVDGRPFLIVPYSLDANDTKFFKGQFFTSTDFGDYLIDGFNEFRHESALIPRMMSVGLHSLIVGRPGRTAGLRRFFERLRECDDIWIARRDDVARFWVDAFGPPALWNPPS
jgi:allantoinase